MVQFDNRFRQIKIKIVYYGPALGGKTTSLQFIHQAIDPNRRTQLFSVNTANDRTIFFDLMSLSLGRIRGHDLTLQLCTVPGQVQYNSTRRAVLSGVDAVVFIADSQADQLEANIFSRTNLDDNLSANGVSPGSIPLVFQLNKQDLDPLTPNHILDEKINPGKAPVFPTIATTGEGVMKAFAQITQMALASVADKLGANYSPRAIARLQQHALQSIEPYMNSRLPGGVELTDQSVVRTETTDAAWPLQDGDMVRQAVQANLEMTDLNANLEAERRKLEQRVEALDKIGEFCHSVGAARRSEEVVQNLLRTTLEQLRSHAGAVLLYENGVLAEHLTEGFERDPLLAAVSTLGQPLACEIIDTRAPALIARDPTADDQNELEYAVEEAGFTSAVAVPLVVRDEVFGLVTVYGCRDRLPLDEHDLKLATAMIASAGFAYAASVNLAEMHGVNVDLETKVAERTAELETKIAEINRLNADLEDQHQLLQRAYRDLEEVDRLKHELLTRVSHELRTPVTSIRSAARILEKYADMDPAESGRFVEIIRSGTERLEEVIEGVVQASTLAAEAGHAEKSPTDLRELVREATSQLTPIAKARGISVTVKAAGGLETVRCDRDALAAALRAVVKNAIDFNSDGGAVEVVARPRSADGRSWTEFSVRDTGVGIPEDDLPHVTEVFWQGGDLMTDKPPGVGLGLTIAARVAEAHGGRLDITSRPGEGTEVCLLIPADESDAA